MHKLRSNLTVFSKCSDTRQPQKCYSVALSVTNRYDLKIQFKPITHCSGSYKYDLIVSSLASLHKSSIILSCCTRGYIYHSIPTLSSIISLFPHCLPLNTITERANVTINLFFWVQRMSDNLQK